MKPSSKPKQDSSHLIHREIRELTAYSVAPSRGLIKLDAMESPYGLNDSLKQKWLEVLSNVQINRYPDPTGADIKARLRRIFAIPDSMEILLGNGSDELLQLIQLAVGGPGRCIMSPMPSFSMYEIIARYTRGTFVGVSLDENFLLNREAWFAALLQNQPHCVFFAYPNNPTGNIFDAQLIEETANKVDGIVVVDEAYFPYAGQSLIDLAQRSPNVIILRTLSKSGLAGLRLGYMFGHKSWMSEFEKLRLPYNIGVLSAVSATFALDYWDGFEQGANVIRSERSRVYQRLQLLDSFQIYPSQANFITFRVKSINAKKLYKILKEKGILVKNLHGSHPVLNQCLRTTIGTSSENDALLSVLEHL